MNLIPYCLFSLYYIKNLETNTVSYLVIFVYQYQAQELDLIGIKKMYWFQIFFLTQIFFSDTNDKVELLENSFNLHF